MNIEDLRIKNDKMMKIRMKHCVENLEWISENEDELREEYGGKYVLVLDQEIKDSDTEWKHLLERNETHIIKTGGPILKYIEEEPLIHLYGGHHEAREGKEHG